MHDRLTVATHSIALVVGLGAGLLAHQSPQKISQETKSQKKEDVEKHQDIAKTSTTTKIERIEEITYSSNGKVASKKTIESTTGQKVQEESKTQVVAKINVKQEDKSYKATLTMPNFSVGVMMPLSAYQSPYAYESSKIDVGYRVLGNAWITAQTDLKLKDFVVGARIEF